MARNWACLRFFEHREIKQFRTFQERYSHGNDLGSSRAPWHGHCWNVTGSLTNGSKERGPVRRGLVTKRRGDSGN